MRPLLAPGMKWSSLAQSAVQAILASRRITRPVIVTGEEFLNRDTWYNLSYAKVISSAIDEGKLSTLTPQGLRLEAKERYSKTPFRPGIFISRVEDADPKKGCALIGGCHHEAFHTLYSLRTDTSSIDPELQNILHAAHSLSPGWGAFAYQWYLFLEDVRIERLGRKEFPGSFVPLCNLQDYILERETPILEDLSREVALTIIFRDLGYGYATAVSKKRLEDYRERHPDIVEMCLQGSFADLLKEARRPAEQQRLEAFLLSLRCTKKAMEEGFQAPSVKPEGSPTPTLVGFGVSLPSLGSASSNETDTDANANLFDDSPEEGESSGEVGAEGSSSEEEDDDGTDDKDDPSGDPFAVTNSDDDHRISLFLGLMDAGPSDDPPSQGQQSPRIFEPGEAPWNPAPCVDDEVTYMKDVDFARVAPAYQEAMKCIHTLRSRFQALLERQIRTEVFHGVERGEGLSEERIVETAIALKAGQNPMEAFYHIQEGVHFNPAIVVCLDGSGSMYGREMKMMAAALAILEPLDSLGAKTLLYVVSAMSSDWAPPPHPYHRAHDVNYQIFKTWEEDIRSQKGRLGSLRVGGGTPLADGIQFGIQALVDREETPKILFVVTDGEPNRGTEGVVRYLSNRLAPRLGIQVLGVGVGSHSQSISQIFNDYLFVSDFDTLASELIKKLTEVFVVKR